MKEKFNAEQVYDYWNQQAHMYGQEPSVSWSDREAIEIEIRELLKYTKDGAKILDAGCANGYTAVSVAMKKKVVIKGIDYIPKMIEEANKRVATLNPGLQERLSFNVGDITQLKECDNSYDQVFVVRVLINLLELNKQVKALEECARVLMPGGLLLLSEATKQGWNKLNCFRAEWGLEAISMPAFNTYLDENELLKHLPACLKLKKIENFSSTYFVGTRVIKPILAKCAELEQLVANPNMEINRWFAQMPSVGDYGTQKLFVFEKQ